MRARDRERVERPSDIAGELPHRIVAGHWVAAAMPAHIEAQNPKPCLQQRRHLLGHMPLSEASECVMQTTGPSSGPTRS